MHKTRWAWTGAALVLATMVGTGAVGCTTPSEAPGKASVALSGAAALPLRTCGRWIVDATGTRTKLVGVNWYGGSDVGLVPGGLDRRDRRDIARLVRSLGFNSVRLPFSTAMLRETRVDPAAVAANPDLVGKTPLEVYDAVVEALAAEGIFVVLNNHTTYAKWCCNFDHDGLWYTRDYPEEVFFSDWERLAERYASQPYVIGADLRNEIRIARSAPDSILPVFPTWGSGNEGTDWRLAAEKAGLRILAKNPRWLVIVEGINSADDLRGVGSQPVQLPPGHLVYSSHQYGFFRPNLPTTPGIDLGMYKTMSESDLRSNLDRQWGYITEGNRWTTAPVWVGEFGAGPDGEGGWFDKLVGYLRDKDLDWSYWSLNGSPKPDGSAETYGLLEEDWATPRRDRRLELLSGVLQAQHGPGIDEPACTEARYGAVVFADRDGSRSLSRDDWDNGALKATCAEDETLVGLSLTGGVGRKAHAALCARTSDGAAVTGARTVVDEKRDSADSGAHTGNDWAPGFTKVECGLSEVVVGVSQRTGLFGGSLSAVRCAQARFVGRACTVRVVDSGRDDRGTGAPYDWDESYVKAQCAEGERVVGVSERRGLPHSLLCCKP